MPFLYLGSYNELAFTGFRKRPPINTDDAGPRRPFRHYRRLSGMDQTIAIRLTHPAGIPITTSGRPSLGARVSKGSWCPSGRSQCGI